MKNNPKYDKRYKGGEDSFLVSSNKRFLGVCDGVGGWGEVDVCSGKFSKWLTNKMRELYDEQKEERPLRDIFIEAVKANPNGGSTTATLAKLLPFEGESQTTSAKMETCNLGDSAYMIVRPTTDHKLVKIHRSKEGTFEFDFPH